MSSAKACETSKSSKFDDKDAILGFGYQVQRTGIRATVATIWPAEDKSTSHLMTEFYANVQTKKLGYSAALQQAQISLATGRSPSGSLVSPNYLNPKKDIYKAEYSHPFFWAPFLLIGNGL